MNIKSINEIEDRLSIKKTFNKPSDISRGIHHQHSSELNKRNYKEFISEKDLQNKFESLMNNSLTGYHSNYISNNYKPTALSWLINKTLNKNQKENILNNYHNQDVDNPLKLLRIRNF